MAHLGIISFQSLDERDVFLKVDVQLEQNLQTDEGLWNMAALGFNTTKPWVGGKGAQPFTVDVDGDSGVIEGWFRGTMFPGLFLLKVYLLYEEVETTEDETTSDENP
jgi:hypothetical protein